jgi:GT2 family glycosyltransferase
MNVKNSIQIILVLYKTKLEDSLSYQTLCSNVHHLKVNYELLIYNNSPEVEIIEKSTYVVVNSESNKMLAGAYNFALKRALKNDRNWLLLLDQDTKLTEDYFIKINEFILSETKNVSAVIPICWKGDRFVSPREYSATIGLSWFCRPLKNGGITKKCISAINSASLLNVSDLKEIGGFSMEYPLDALDHWYYFQFFKKQKNILILDTVIEQNLSLFDFKKNVSIHRYYSILNAELKFNKEIGIIAIIAWKLRLIPRAIKLIGKKVKISYITMTLSFLFK